MKNCLLCQQSLKVGDQMVVLAFPVKCTHDGGDYSLIGEFCQKETLVHLHCVSKVFPDFSDIFLGKTSPKTRSSCNLAGKSVPTQVPSASVQETETLYDALKELGEKPTYIGLYKFVSENKDISDTGSLIQRWFASKK